MKTFIQFLCETVSKLSWEGNPKIGWWQDAKPLYLYHGTHINNLESVSKQGIGAPTEGYTAGWVSLALEPNTAFGYASMHGGEASFRSAGKEAKHVPVKDRIVFVLKFNSFEEVKKLGLGSLRGMVEATKNKLTNKSLYDNWKDSDQEYYALTELRVKKHIPPKFITGYMKK